MTIDVIELLRKQIEILQNVDKIKAEDDVSQYEDAVDTILEHVDHIDVACGEFLLKIVITSVTHLVFFLNKTSIKLVGLWCSTPV